MEEASIRDLEQQALGEFRKSFTKRYEQWKRTDLLVLAMETMPKQVNKNTLLHNLLKLWYKRLENINEE
jgi:hypothetical protein